MCVEYRRDDYESGMADLQTLEDNDVRTVYVTRISFSTECTMPIEACSVTTTWAQRVAAREREVYNDEEHHRLCLDLIEHLWSRDGDNN